MSERPKYDDGSDEAEEKRRAEEAMAYLEKGVAIVIDTKFGDWVQAGFAGDDEPKLVFHSHVTQQWVLEVFYRHIFVQLGFNGVSVDINNMGDVKPLLPVFLTQPPNNSAGNQVALAELMFNVFKVPAIYIGIQPVLSLYASGTTTGLVVESGDDKTYIVPVIQGGAFPDGITTFAGKDLTNVSTFINESIMKCSEDIRASLYGNIVLSGSGTMVDGIAASIEKEVLGLAPQDTKVVILAPSHRKYASWIGASITASLDTFQDQWITKEEYDEQGVDILKQKLGTNPAE